MFAASLAPFRLLHQPAALRPVANTRARPAVALVNELWTPDALPAISALPPGFESLMPHAAAEHHTPFSRHLFNAILAYVALDTSCFAFSDSSRRGWHLMFSAPRTHGAPVSRFFSGAKADVLKAYDNQTGTAAVGSSREPLF